MSNPNIEITLVAPCLNEEGNVRELASRFFHASREKGIDVELVFVDDGSTDETWERLREISDIHRGSVQLVRHAANRGIPESWISGVEVARGRFVCLIDSDLQNPPESVIQLYDELLSRNLSLVRGVRRASTRQHYGRIVMSKSLNTLLNLIFGMKSRDNKSGFLLGRTELVLQIVRHRGHYKHYQTFIGVAAHSLGICVGEIETPFHERMSGISFLSGKSLRVICQVLMDIPEAKREFGNRIRVGES